MLHLYGLKNCDTCRKARRWLDEHGLEHEFHDLRESPPALAQIEQWLTAIGHDQLLNRRSTTWRELSEVERAHADGPQLASLLAARPALIKRPILEGQRVLRCGFDADAWAQALGVN